MDQKLNASSPATFTDTVCGGQLCLSRLSPSSPIRFWLLAAFPSRMGNAFQPVMTPPQGRAGMATKDMLTMKVRDGAAKGSIAPIAFSRPPVTPPRVSRADPALAGAARRAEPPCSRTPRHWLTAHGAEFYRLDTAPSVLKIALARTESLVWPCVLRMIILAALHTLFDVIVISHATIVRACGTQVKPNIEISEKYCTIARNRLANTPKPLFTEQAEKPKQAGLYEEAAP